MTASTSGSEGVLRPGAFRQLALFRALLSVSYLAAEGFLSGAGLTRSASIVTGLFVGYSLALLVLRFESFARKFPLAILFFDLIFLLSLIIWGTTPVSAGVAAAFFAFLVLESWSMQEAREVILLATALTLVVYSARLGAGSLAPMTVTVHSVLFLLVVGGLLAFLFSDQRYITQQRILAIAQQIADASETSTVASMQAGLKELAAWFRCSHALLAFWDEQHEHFCLCRYPAASGLPSGAPELEDSREWSVFRGEHFDFWSDQVTATEAPATPAATRASSGTAGGPGYDVHPHLIRKFQIYNAVGCGLYSGNKVIGRLVLVNRVAPMRGYLLARLKRVAPAFAKLVRHILVIRTIEHAAYEDERRRLARDFHDGPLQSVISFQMRVHTILKLLDRDPAAATLELEQLQELARKQVTEMRTFVNSMRPVEVDTTSLTAAARRLADDFQKESGVPVTFLGGDEPVSAPGRAGIDILQIIREALHNIHKHAQATHVLLSLEKNDNHLTVAVNDNGRGFRFGGRYTLEELETLRLGPNSIKQRTRALGGDIVLESQPGHGTSLRLKIPLY